MKPSAKARTVPRSRMSGVDTAWLRMDRATNPMVITAVMTFRKRIALPALKKVIVEHFLVFDRFRQLPVEGTGGHYWESAADFDLERHVHRVALPRPAGKRELQELVSDLASGALDPRQPMWQFHLVDGYGGGGCALVSRIHHCYADGVALMRVLLSLTEETPARPARRAAVDGGLAWMPWLEPLSSASAKVLEWSSAFWRTYFELLLRPGKVLEYAQAGSGFLMEAARLLAMSPEPPTRFRGKPGLQKRAAWSDPLPLAEAKAAGAALGCSINDVLLCAAAGALRSYLSEHGEPVDGLEMRAIVPVNLRDPESAEQLGNRFGLVFVSLPVGIANPLQRLYEVHTRMQALRHSPQPMLLLGLLEFAGQSPLAVQEQLLQILGSHATAVMTNLPGPQKRLRLAGAEIDQQMFWVPQSGEIGMGLSLFSYAGQVQFGLMTDAGMVPDPERIVSRFRDEIRKLRKARPWKRSG